MTITVDAIYENGVLKPAQPLPLQEHAQVSVTVEQAAEQSTSASQPVAADMTAAERIAARAAALPVDVVSDWPTDGAAQHDHYLYGTPKRPE
jgi:predicted DNA-binding antitoxin AbrB/MazE fold protein